MFGLPIQTGVGERAGMRSSTVGQSSKPSRMSATSRARKLVISSQTLRS